MFKFSFIILVLIASNVLFSTIPSNVAARNAITTCSAAGLGFEPCSTHDFLASWQSLRELGGIEKDELIKKIRCVRKDRDWDNSFHPQDCGVFEGGYVKDVAVSFVESGFLFNKQKLVDQISFKIIADKTTFQKIVNNLKFLDDFNLSSRKGLFINCSNEKIYNGAMYQSYLPGAFRSAEVMNDGKRCRARGYFSRHKDGNFELWWLSFDHLIVNGFENINVTLSSPIK